MGTTATGTTTSSPKLIKNQVQYVMIHCCSYLALATKYYNIINNRREILYINNNTLYPSTEAKETSAQSSS